MSSPGHAPSDRSPAEAAARELSFMRNRATWRMPLHPAVEEARMKNDIVIARYSEDLDWIENISNEFTVYIYNKESGILSEKILKRADSIVKLPNFGRESDTILRHVLEQKLPKPGYTVFLQGDPFEHSPDIIGLLNCWKLWKDIQPLSWVIAHPGMGKGLTSKAARTASRTGAFRAFAVLTTERKAA